MNEECMLTPVREGAHFVSTLLFVGRVGGMGGSAVQPLDVGIAMIVIHITGACPSSTHTFIGHGLLGNATPTPQAPVARPSGPADATESKQRRRVRNR